MSALRTRRPLLARRAVDPEQRTIVLIRVLLGFESVLYSVLTPVLPYYAHAFGASKPAIGMLTAAYPAGMIPGALLGGWIATRAGVRRTTVLGLLLFTCAIVAFGFGSDLVALDGLRFVRGSACGCIWGGGLAWVIAISPPERRGCDARIVGFASSDVRHADRPGASVRSRSLSVPGSCSAWGRRDVSGSR